MENFSVKVACADGNHPLGVFRHGQQLGSSHAQFTVVRVCHKCGWMGETLGTVMEDGNFLSSRRNYIFYNSNGEEIARGSDFYKISKKLGWQE